MMVRLRHVCLPYLISIDPEQTRGQSLSTEHAIVYLRDSSLRLLQKVAHLEWSCQRCGTGVAAACHPTISHLFTWRGKCKPR